MSLIAKRPQEKKNVTTSGQWFTTAQVAERFDTTDDVVRRWITRLGILDAKKVGSVYLVHEDALRRFERPKPGRPSKTIGKEGA